MPTEPLMTPPLLPLFVLGLLVPAMLWLELKAAPAQSRASQWPLAVWWLHLGVFCLGFALLLLVVQRPWFAGLLLLAGGLVLMLVNNAKHHSLREPFLFHDFSYFTAAIRYPRLYLPFLGLGRAILAVLVGGLVFAAGVWLEPAMDKALLWSALFGVVGVMSLGLIWHWQPALALEPAVDVKNLGLWGAWWAYWRRSGQIPPLQQHHGADGIVSALRKKEILPDLLVVQSESFFDPRTEYPYINSEILAEFDQISDVARYSGKLRVPAWGANTVRAECAFLTGIPPESWDVHQFNPYRILPRVSVMGLAKLLNSCGYHTVCVHPYEAGFYQRDGVMRQLGFERFVDISDFSKEDYCGQYVGDKAVTERVTRLLRERVDPSTPLFVFVITMENHGPLHLDRPDDLDEQALYDVSAAPDWRELSSYLYHLHHADEMIVRLKDALSIQERPGVLAWYGDHVPIIPDFYQRYGAPRGDTNYFVWASNAESPFETRDVAVHDLHALVLKTVLLS